MFVYSVLVIGPIEDVEGHLRLASCRSAPLPMYHDVLAVLPGRLRCVGSFELVSLGYRFTLSFCTR